MTFKSVFLLWLLMSVPVMAQHHGHGAHQPKGHGQPTTDSYAGQQERSIASLSSTDIEQLQQGGGWGLAKPAELNGFPGPLHLLELVHEIELSEAQEIAINKLYEEMRSEAIMAGEMYLQAEFALDEAFESGIVNPDLLEKLLNESAEALASLRLVHLSAHLATKPLLTPQQVQRYNELRGYSEG